jgi:hypothetical protein
LTYDKNGFIIIMEAIFKMKKFISGFLIGAILFSVMPVKAAIEEFICYRADYKVLVDGTEYTNTELPILNYKGNTYAPFRSILEAAGLTVAWNAKLKQAEVTAPIINTTITEGVNTMSETTTTITQTPDGLVSNFDIASLTATSNTTIEIVSKVLLDKSIVENVNNYALREDQGNESGAVAVISATLDSSGTKLIVETEQQNERTIHRLDISYLSKPRWYTSYVSIVPSN